MIPRCAMVACVIALSACGGDACEDAIALRLNLPCCDAHEAWVGVSWPDGTGEMHLVDTTRVIEGGLVELRLPFPAGVTSGTADVSFYAWGDGQETFEAMGDVMLVAGACAELELDVRSWTGPDAGP